MTESIWSSIVENQASYPSLNRNIEVDVVIIGGGITGITTALQIAKSGKKVAVLEANTVGSGTTGNSTGNLYIPIQPYFQTIFSKFNAKTAKEIATARQYAIDFIEHTIEQENIACGFRRRPWFLYTNNTEKLSFLKKEVECLRKMDLSVDDVQELPLSFKFKKAAVLNHQARFNPLQYVLTLAEKLHRKGVRIFENTRVVSREENGSASFFTDKHFKVTAKIGIIATHTPIGINPIQLYTAPYRSYVVAAHLQNNTYPEGHFWDLDYPHHVTCTHSMSGEKPDVVMVSGNHHKTGQNQAHRDYFKELEQFLQQNLPVSEFVHRWSAQHYHAADSVPYIGLVPGAEHTYMATGYFADGLVYGTLAGIIFANVIAESNNEWQKTFDSRRTTPLASASFLVKENFNTFSQYLKDLPLLSSKMDFQDLKPGQGKVVEINREKCAVSKDDNNQVHIVSAVCTHMKCIVNWNDMERTWDCPCHGSRFTCEGKVIEGPAQIDLEIKSGV